MAEKITFVLIPGSWHSAWKWLRVTPLLEEQGFPKLQKIDHNKLKN